MGNLLSGDQENLVWIFRLTVTTPEFSAVQLNAFEVSGVFLMCHLAFFVGFTFSKLCLASIGAFDAGDLQLQSGSLHAFCVFGSVTFHRRQSREQIRCGIGKQ